MPTRSAVAVVISTLVHAVMFGAGAAALMAVPALTPNAAYLLTTVIIASLLLTPFLAWWLTPQLQAKVIRFDQRRGVGKNV